MSGKLIVIRKLVSTGAVTALVAERIWPNRAPEGNAEQRYIIVSAPGQSDRQLLEGDAGYPRTRVRIECLAESAMAALAIQQAAFAALKDVTNETIDDGSSPPAFSAVASIMSASFHTDGYSDARQAFAEIFDVYVDWT